MVLFNGVILFSVHGCRLNCRNMYILCVYSLSLIFSITASLNVSGKCKRRTIAIGIGALSLNLFPACPLLAEGIMVGSNFSLFFMEVQAITLPILILVLFCAFQFITLQIESFSLKFIDRKTLQFSYSFRYMSYLYLIHS